MSHKANDKQIDNIRDIIEDWKSGLKLFKHGLCKECNKECLLMLISDEVFMHSKCNNIQYERY
jgi:hypothetical protein